MPTEPAGSVKKRIIPSDIRSSGVALGAGMIQLATQQ